MKRSRRYGLAMAATAGVLVLSACGGQQGNPNDGSISGPVAIDGSSTVAPLSEAAATLYRDVESRVYVTVATSGTGGGFKKFCAGETDISDASRPIKAEEIEACEQNGVEYTEIVVANDGLSIVVNPDNDWVSCLTVDQLALLWGPDSEGVITNWKQVDPSFPDEEITLFGAGTDSGTFDYFTAAINGEEGAVRTDYSPSEDDNIVVQGVSGDVGALGFLGLSYIEENPTLMKAVAIDSGDGCVLPSTETVQSGAYTPLGRPLFIYVNNGYYLEKPQLRAFIDFYIETQDQISREALFVPLTLEQQQIAQEELEGLH